MLQAGVKQREKEGREEGRKSCRYQSQALARVSGPAGSKLLSHTEGQRRKKKHRRVVLRAVNYSLSMDIMVNRIIRTPSVGQTGCCFFFFLPGQATQSRPCGLSPLFVSSFFLCLQPPCFLFRHRLLASSLSPSPHHLTQHFYKQAIFYGCATSSVNNLDYITTLKCLETTWCLPQQPFKTHSSSPSSLHGSNYSKSRAGSSSNI